jgi:hypothetical protein
MLTIILVGGTFYRLDRADAGGVEAAPETASPRFMVRALRDPDGVNLNSASLRTRPDGRDRPDIPRLSRALVCSQIIQ